MPKIIIRDLAPLDGEYEFEMSRFKGTDLRIIKQIAGVRGNELEEALQAGDYDLVIAFAAIALSRAGKTVTPEQLLEADVGSITIDYSDDTEEVEERPPVSLSPSGNESSPGDTGKQSESTVPSGSPSNGTGDPLPSLPSPTGPLGSETSAGFAQETLAS